MGYPSDPSFMSGLIMDCSWCLWKRQFDIGHACLLQTLVDKLLEQKTAPMCPELVTSGCVIGNCCSWEVLQITFCFWEVLGERSNLCLNPTWIYSGVESHMHVQWRCIQHEFLVRVVINSHSGISWSCVRALCGFDSYSVHHILWAWFLHSPLHFVGSIKLNDHQSAFSFFDSTLSLVLNDNFTRASNYQNNDLHAQGLAFVRIGDFSCY